MIGKMLLGVAAVTLTIMAGADQSVAAPKVTPAAGVKAAFNLLCQSSAQIVAGGTVNKHALKTIAQADVITLSTQLNVSPFVAATYLATAAQEIYTDKLAIDACPANS